uniref:Metalloendopeptidase n=1 Tax=Rhabditophanes sp. KR3021 TaxID=114890 RepID=A0AC35UAI3_9BILA
MPLNPKEVDLEQQEDGDMIWTDADMLLTNTENYDGNKTMQPQNNTIFYTALAKQNPKKWLDYVEGEKYVIPYSLSNNYSLRDKKMIRTSMDEIEKYTCIIFKERTKQDNYIFVSDSGVGCFSYVGRLGGKQQIQLSAGRRETCMTKRIVAHELLHVVGLYHEHMRNDRDDYIKINFDNIREGSENQFLKIDGAMVSNYDVSYDYKSIMHYGKSFFAKNPTLVTIEPKNITFLDVIGHNVYPSPNDYAQVCLMYECKKCDKSSGSSIKFSFLLLTISINMMFLGIK